MLTKTKAPVIVLTLTIFLVGVTMSALAEDKPADNMQLVLEKIKVDKKAYIAQYLQLTEAEGKEFWPYYNSYQFDLQKINDRLITLIDDYAKNYNKLSDQDAVKMVNEYLSIERDELKQKELYFRTLNKKLPAKKVARYLQLENKMRAIVEYELATRVPLIK